MNTHSKAKLTARNRAEMIRRIVDLQRPVAEVAAGFGVSVRTAYKWLARFRAEGSAGLHDRRGGGRDKRGLEDGRASSRPTCPPRTTEAAAPGTSGGWSVGEPHPFRVARVLTLRRRRLPGFQIARAAKLSKASVSRLLRRHRLRLAQLSPPPPIVRYERAHPGELLHFDIKKLARRGGGVRDKWRPENGRAIVRTGHRITGDRRGGGRDKGGLVDGRASTITSAAGWEYLHIEPTARPSASFKLPSASGPFPQAPFSRLQTPPATEQPLEPPQGGILPWLDEREIRPGELWQEALTKQIAKVKTMAVFLGDVPYDRYQKLEAQKFLPEFVNRGAAVIPVFLPGAKSEPEVPEFLPLFHAVDFRKTDPDPLEQLIWGITGDRASSRAMR